MNKNDVPQNIINEMLKTGIDLSKWPENKRKAICELYGYKFDNLDNDLQKTNEKSNGYALELTKKDNKQSAYVDALVLALVTGLFGGIFLTIVASIIK